ncbi:hypothetical protein HRG_001246 [Hirsutella rhossiliensis]|uniref:Fungal N-terminal domain-containing protein n=1 Tax=Hirsutella rhossiliensis TaxID=111463 RepID=A0A9P8N8C7_9HYPO|nr:uncharacterized protein HRG_01246 [Hirsutella rhossiliensis]KAH0968604.1 hypothetical protein HRG_01246 [Hirsutella rhossiliensis]
MAWALAEVTDVRSTIARLQSLIQHIESVPNATRSRVGVQHTAVAVAELIDSFDHLASLLKHVSLSNPAALKTWDQIHWARKQDDVAKAVLRIQTHKRSITLMLNILQCESDIVAVESRATLKNKINTKSKKARLSHLRL